MPKYGIVNVAKLNLREGPNATAKIVTVLVRGNVLEIVKETSPDWVQAKVDGSATQGFVASIYLTFSDTKPGTTPPPDPAPSPRAEVISNSLNVRAGAGTNFNIVTVVTKGTVLNVIEKLGEWVKVRVGAGEGFVAAQYVDLNTTKPATGYLIEMTELLNAELLPDRIIPNQSDASAAVVARTWNSYGGLISRLSRMLSVPNNTIVAVLAAESGGNAFGKDGRMIIRFEVHIFYNSWGAQNPQNFDRFFAFDRSPGNSWKGHLFRSDVGQPWIDFHGNQDKEWQVLTIARALDDTAALSSISMGAPQVMGFNHRRIGYDTVQKMFFQFARSAQAQLLALFDFVRGTGGSSQAITALQNRDYLTFATLYNGSGNAPTYAGIIQRYSALYDQVIRTAQPRT